LVFLYQTVLFSLILHPICQTAITWPAVYCNRLLLIIIITIIIY